MELAAWASKIQEETYREWAQKYPSWKPGFKVFYSPVHRKPNLLIISLQPGGSEAHFAREDRPRFERGDFSVQIYNSYVASNTPMARGVKKLFSNLSLLEESVIVPLVFFRAKNYAMWKKFPMHRDAEVFCAGKVKDILTTLQPRQVLILGLQTYEKMKTMLPSSEERVLYRRGGAESGGRMAISGLLGGIPAISIIHPSGARAATKDVEQLKHLLGKRLE